MTPKEERIICEEILRTSKSLEEILRRITQVLRTIKMKQRSLYLYDKREDHYFIESNESRFYLHRHNDDVKELTKDEYFKAILPDWGTSIINCLDE